MSQNERRRSKRRPVVETFALAVVVPKKGLHRLAIYDVSDVGLYFDLDEEGEEPGGFPIKEGESLDIRFYLNPSLSIPLSVVAVRVEEREMGRRVGVEIKDLKSKSYPAYLAFLKLLDALAEVGTASG